MKVNLTRLFYLRAKGLNAQEIANDMKVTKVTIHRHLRKFREMDDTEFLEYFKEVLLIK